MRLSDPCGGESRKKTEVEDGKTMPQQRRGAVSRVQVLLLLICTLVTTGRQEGKRNDFLDTFPARAPAPIRPRTTGSSPATFLQHAPAPSCFAFRLSERALGLGGRYRLSREPFMGARSVNVKDMVLEKGTSALLTRAGDRRTAPIGRYLEPLREEFPGR